MLQDIDLPRTSLPPSPIAAAAAAVVANVQVESTESTYLRKSLVHPSTQREFVEEN